MPPRMHDEEIEIDPPLVASLIDGQFPQWAAQPVARVRSSGTDHAIFRLGDELSVRLPRVAWAVGPLVREHEWLPRIAAHLPAETPTPIGIGRPAMGYPWPWTVCRWVTGDNPRAGSVPDATRLAGDLSEFIAAMRRLDRTGAPATVWSRPLHLENDRVRSALDRIGSGVDGAATWHAWQAAVHAAPCADAETWIHGDLAPGNLLLAAGRLHGVIDFSAMGVGDPASDLRPAWNLLPPHGRVVLRERVGIDASAWFRGRGWVVLQALVQLDYLQDRNPVLTANARHVLEQVRQEVVAGEV